jgi:hypothetical protein
MKEKSKPELPETIYLQNSPDEQSDGESGPVLWFRDRLSNASVEYIRADVVRKKLMQNLDGEVFDSSVNVVHHIIKLLHCPNKENLKKMKIEINKFCDSVLKRNSAVISSIKKEMEKLSK